MPSTLLPSVWLLCMHIYIHILYIYVYIYNDIMYIKYIHIYYILYTLFDPF